MKWAIDQGLREKPFRRFIVVGKRDRGTSSGSSTYMQLLASYAHGILDSQASDLVQNTVYPAFGMEVEGDSFR